MKSSLLVGILLIVFGAISLGYGGFTYTRREKVVDLGPIEAFADKKHTVPLSPIVGAILLVTGAVVVFRGSGTGRKPLTA